MRDDNDHLASITADEFQHAIKQGQLFLEFQPIVQLSTGRIRGLEALMRWSHPARGLVPPALFIPLAYRAGLMFDAGRWALKESCRTLKRLERSVGLEHDLFMSVNFAGVDFAASDFIDHLYTVLSETDLHPRKLRLELTERCLLGDLPNATQTLAMCRQAGLGITIDDYGLDQSFGGHLHEYPIDTVKIAPAIVQAMMTNPQAHETAAAIADRARHLGLTVSAVGVEHPEEAQALASMGCQLAQGYAFSPPVPGRDLLKLFAPSESQAVLA